MRCRVPRAAKKVSAYFSASHPLWRQPIQSGMFTLNFSVLMWYHPNMGLREDCYPHMTDIVADSAALLIFLTLAVSLLVTVFAAS